MLEDMAKIKVMSLRTLNEIVSLMEKHSKIRKQIFQQFSLLLTSQTTLKNIM